jgi:hypothetical protein
VGNKSDHKGFGQNKKPFLTTAHDLWSPTPQIYLCVSISTMGLQSSKIHHPCCVPAHGKRPSQDDMQSKVTETTVDSSILLPSPPFREPSRDASTAATGTRGNPNHNLRRGSRSFPSLPQQATMSNTRRRKNQDDMHTMRVPSLQRGDSDPEQGAGSASVPVKCPPRKTSSATGHGLPAISPPEGEDSQILMRMYDTRTWEMYQRITEARKHSQYSQTHPPLSQLPSESPSEWEHLQHDYMDSPESSHEMVFLFDFD